MAWAGDCRAVLLRGRGEPSGQAFHFRLETGNGGGARKASKRINTLGPLGPLWNHHGTIQQLNGGLSGYCHESASLGTF